MCDISNPIFQDAEKARLHLEELRWEHGRACPHCGHYKDREVLEVAEEWNNGNGRKSAVAGGGLIAGYHFDEGAGTITADFSGNGGHVETGMIPRQLLRQPDPPGSGRSE